MNGLLLRQGLVDEVSLLICPSLVGGERQGSIFKLLILPLRQVRPGRDLMALSLSHRCTEAQRRYDVAAL
ncbi:MAG: hypothetical protein ACP5PV_08755 [Methanothrix sp.]